MIRVRYQGTELYPEGLVEELEGDGYKILDDNTVEILLYRDGELDAIGVIRNTRWDSIVVVEEKDKTFDPP